MKTLLCIVCAGMLTVFGCGGREAHPVQIYQPGDDQRSCTSLMAEVAQCESEIERLEPESDKTAYNLACAVSGAFILVPWFFIDLKNAEKTELEAMTSRRDYLQQLAADKDCTEGPYRAAVGK